uniref:Tryptophan synthase beta chain-like PALP domain-containing protein n=1 Tax=Hordeum vulgare subsp. vulgare TaxID=112509 RepID=A0A8I6YHV9_HORVV
MLPEGMRVTASCAIYLFNFLQYMVLIVVDICCIVLCREAFKIRGASNSIFALDNSQAAKGVVTHSSGNHAAVVALAAKLCGISAYIVIPKNAPACKVDNVKRYGSQVIWSDVTMDSRESMAKKVQEETGAILIHPFNDKYTISGQGTVCLELLEQVPKIDTIIVPISGGSLISGVALAAKAINPSIRILPAEPKGADDLAQPVVRDLVDDVIVVYDNAIVDAMKMCYETLKVAVEPSGAIGLAAALSDDEFKQSSAWHESNKIGIIVSRGNVDLSVLWDSLYK